MVERCFHVVLPDDWARRPGRGWAPRSLALCGFIHASTASQLAGTLEEHYADATDVYLLELCPLRTADALRFEASRDGALFPHLYRELEPEDVLRWWKLHSRGGRWKLPDFAVRHADDGPSGHDGTPPDQLP
ncbi:MAG: DUF952 domain-containing protein [Planctomycetes bacterium]|nr:DUF952 domain-containing protein [Planctomycetota bacterium]MCB9906039.1 DUF952 domain-containing protein [Planctomycetota bacterium]